jgi:hypothetical protein
MMTITISIPDDDDENIGIHTVARAVLPGNVKPMLRRAVRALEAELNAVDECPWHRAMRPQGS